MNRIVIKGNVGNVKELQFVGAKNTALLKFSVATTEYGRPNQQGQRPEPKTTWHNVTCWGKQAQELVGSGFLTKGAKVSVEGRQENYDYQSKKFFDQQGQPAKMPGTQIVAKSVDILNNIAPMQQPQGGYQQPQQPVQPQQPAQPQYAPAPPAAAPAAPAPAPQQQQWEDDESDLPF